MGKDYQLRKDYYFVFYFFLKVEPSGRIILITLLEQIFCLVKMSFRNHLVLCMATVAVSCRNKLLMQNLIPANINLISGYFFSPIAATESKFYI